MSTLTQTAPRGPFDGPSNGVLARNAHLPSPLTAESPHGEAMDLTSPPNTAVLPPVNGSPELDQRSSNTNGTPDHTAGAGSGTAAGNTSSSNGAAAAVAPPPQPKIVQTAFIHKLYNMLEDQGIRHLISWSSNNESFVMSPTNEFSKVLAQYFKHTNISSFVRQLNMYGFHKVSDVFHTGSPESAQWEFKHGNGNFKKGDISGLREIKRRASRHALIHRESFSAQKPVASQPGTPAEPLPDTTDVRLLNLEHAFYDMQARLTRTEESCALLSSRCQALTEGLVRCHQVHYICSSFSSIRRLQTDTDAVPVDPFARALCPVHVSPP